MTKDKVKRVLADARRLAKSVALLDAVPYDPCFKKGPTPEERLLQAIFNEPDRTGGTKRCVP